MKLFITLCLLGLTYAYEDKTLVQYLADNGYSVLVGALNSTGLVPALAGTGPFTVFAPTDKAFQNVALNGLTTEQLATILKYHVVGEFVLVPMISQPTTRTTLASQDITLQSVAGTLVINSGTSGSARVDNLNNDIIVRNGVVQPIDSVLMPPMLPTAAPTTTLATPPNYTLDQVLIRQEQLRDFNIALLLADLVTDIRVAKEYTVFAPSDSAFALYQNNLLDPSAPNAQAIYQEVLKYHLVPGTRRASVLKTGPLFTMHGTTLNVTVGSGVMINNARVVDADILASNGVIHIIDKVLIPQDINNLVSGGNGKK